MKGCPLFAAMEILLHKRKISSEIYRVSEQLYNYNIERCRLFELVAKDTQNRQSIQCKDQIQKFKTPKQASLSSHL